MKGQVSFNRRCNNGYSGAFNGELGVRVSTWGAVTHTKVIAFQLFLWWRVLDIRCWWGAAC